MKFIDSIVEALIKEGFPGGVGVGLTLPNGYINGAPDNSDEDDKNEDIIPGGKSEGKSLADLANKYNVELSKIKEELTKGVKVEMEHTNDVRKAAEIAKDHLWEDLDYYTKLAKIEKTNEISEASQSGTGYSNQTLDLLVVNPETDEQIKVRSALNYPKNHPAYKAAIKLVNANEPEKKAGDTRHKHIKRLKTRPKWNPGGKPSTGTQITQPDNIVQQPKVSQLIPNQNDVTSNVKTFKGQLSGKEIKTVELEGGGYLFGTQHGDNNMADDIINQVKATIPKDRWKDMVFVGEGGWTGKSGEIEFNQEMKYAAPKFKKMGAGVDTWDGDDLDVHKPDSNLYKKQIEKTGLNQSQVNAGNWASMIGQGEWTDTMKPATFLDDEGKGFLQDAAKEAGFPSIENWDEPTEQDVDTLYRLSFPEDMGDKETKVNDIQVAFNNIRDENLISKQKELAKQGKIPIVMAGESHADLVDNLLQREKREVNYNKFEGINEGLIMEGGAAGHLAHPFEDEDLTFDDMKEMINRGLIGGLDKEAPVSEKLDGQNIAFSVRDGKVVFGRNKGHVRNSGENALDVKGIYNQFKGRGGIEKAFVGAAEDLQSAVKKLTPQQVKKMFGNGSSFMSLEIILPDTTNVIPYGKSVLVMHGTIQYDKDGNEVSRSTDDANTFATAVQKVGADRQKTFGIEGPKTIAFSDAESKEYTKKAKEYNSQLDKAASEFGLKDKSKLADYRTEWWKREIETQQKNNKLQLSNKEKAGLVKRWADGDKSFGVKSFSDDRAKEWFRNYETNNLAKSQKQMIKPIEMVFLNVGAQSLRRVTNFLASNNPKAADALRKETIKSIKGIKDSKDTDKLTKLQIELERLESIGMDKIVPSEGVVFQYNGKPYKFTGAFAPINQIQGTFKFDKPKKEDTKKEETPKNEVAIFTGRFQPFHAGHYSIYEALVKKFGKDNVYISSSNVMDAAKSPFPFKEKKAIMTKMFGIPANKVVQVKNPYQPTEILSKLPKDTTYVTAVSQKDAERLEQGGKYFKNYSSVSDTKKKGYEDEGYYIVAPEMQLKVNGKNISGTQLRATFGDPKMSIADKRKIFNQVYPKFDKDIFARIVVRTSNAEKAKIAKDKPKVIAKDKTKPKSNKKVTDFKGNKRVQKVLNQKIKNPDTGRMILVKTALGYDKGVKVRKSAMQLVKNAMG